jgi:hypothetical protein
MAIVLVGAMSRRVNDTTDDELAAKDPASMTITCKKDESSDVSPSGPESEAEMAILRLARKRVRHADGQIAPRHGDRARRGHVAPR